MKSVIVDKTDLEHRKPKSLMLSALMQRLEKLSADESQSLSAQMKEKEIRK